MHLDQLRYLLTLQMTGSITQTANHFFISHQAISKSLKALENELSVTLFERSNKGAKLTPAGERVCQFAHSVLHEHEILNRDLASYHTCPQQKLEGTLTLYTIPRYIKPPFLAFIQKLQSIHTRLDLTLHTVTAEKIFHEVVFAPTMLGLTNLITNGNDIPSELTELLAQRELVCRILDQRLLYACVYHKSPLSAKKILTIEDRQQFSCVSFTYTSYLSPETIHKYNTAHVKFTMDSFEQQKTLLKKQKSCFGLYTLKEYDYFFQKDFTLIPLADQNQPLMLFIAIYSRCHEALIDEFLQHYCKTNI